MNKIFILMLCLFLVAGCSDKKSEISKDEKQEEVTPEVTPEEIIEYIDDNPIKVGLYIYTNNRRILADTYESAWPIYTDINGFTAYFSNEKEISNARLQNVWKSLYQNYTDIDDYKIGYHLKFNTKTETISKTILKPSDGNEVYQYLQVYLYDDIHQDSSWYSHMNDSDIKDNTIFTTIKLTTSTKIDEIISDIELTVFTYNDLDDFDSNEIYRGNSSYTTIIKRK